MGDAGTKWTPGAMRAALHLIGEDSSRLYVDGGWQDAEHVAEIIDRETVAQELYKALEAAIRSVELMLAGSEGLTMEARERIRKEVSEWRAALRQARGEK